MTIIRLAQANDYLNHLKLYEQLTQIEPDKISINDYCEFLQYSTQKNTKIYVVVDEETNKLMGCGTLIIEKKLIHNLGKVGHIEDVVVDSKYRGKNIGKKLIEFLLNLAKEEKCYKVILDCVIDKVGFYEKCGLEQKGVQMVKYF